MQLLPTATSCTTVQALLLSGDDCQLSSELCRARALLGLLAQARACASKIAIGV